MILFPRLIVWKMHKKVADEAISLFSNRGFKSVKSSANKEPKVVLLSQENDLLATFIRNLDLQADDTSLPPAKKLGCIWKTEQDKLLVNCTVKKFCKFYNPMIAKFIKLFTVQLLT